jgi:predicted transcriptional regulator
MPSDPTSFRLSDEAVRLLRLLEEETGLKRSAVLEQAIRSYAKKTLKKFESTR